MVGLEKEHGGTYKRREIILARCMAFIGVLFAPLSLAISVYSAFYASEWNTTLSRTWKLTATLIVTFIFWRLYCHMMSNYHYEFQRNKRSMLAQIFFLYFFIAILIVHQICSSKTYIELWRSGITTAE